MCHVFLILQDVEDASFQPTSSGLIPLILLRRCCSHNIEKLPTISRNLPTTRKTFPGLKNGSSHVMRKTIKRVLRRPFSGLQGPRNGQKGSPQVPASITFMYKCSVNCSAVWAGWQPLRPFSGLHRPEKVKKGHHSGLSVVYLCVVLLPLLLLLLTALLPRFRGTYQIYLDRAVWAGWQPLRPFSGLRRPETVKKGHHSGLSVVYLCDYNATITTATIATNCYTTTLSWNLPDLP